MGQIHELSEALTNQIAAGEVIERPASVIKELVENSIDAGANQIDVLVVDAGIKLMEVVDNGHGIAADDVETAFKRHATSKIATVRDLFTIHSLGFRGEALASIASVAEVTLQTATEAGKGTSLHVTGGKIIDKHSEPVRQGTTIKVANLFFNTPARLKYVKSQSTEFSHILDIMNRLALGHPEIAFTLRNGDKMAFKTVGNGDLQQTIAGIYGVEIARSVLRFEGQDNDFAVTGYVSTPDTTRSNRNYLTLLINGRYFKNFNLVKGIINGYGSKLMVGRFPMAVIDIRLDPQLVDVNVHPTKQEVRISKERDLAALLAESIRARLAGENLIPDALQNLRGREKAPQSEQTNLAVDGANSSADLIFPEVSASSNRISVNVPAPASTLPNTSKHGPAGRASGPTPISAADAVPGHSAFANADQVHEPQAVLPTAPLTSDKPESTARPNLTIADLDGESIFNDRARLAAWDERYMHSQPVTAAEPTALAGLGDGLAADAAVETAAHSGDRFPKLRYLGQLHGTYLLAETPDAFYMVDQHAAQERVNYEFYRVEIGKVTGDQQQLLTPIVLDYPARDAVLIRERGAVLAEVGVHLEDFGQNSFIASGHPTWFKAGQEEDTLREMIDWVLDDGHLTVAKFREKTAIMMSCKRAIKANQHLDTLQAQALLTKLAEAENPFNCPHGRPVLVSFDNTDLQKMFKRIQDSHDSKGWAD